MTYVVTLLRATLTSYQTRSSVSFHDNLVFLFPPDGPDTPEIFPPHKYFEEGRSMWLSCQAVSHPKAHYSWNVNGEPWNARQELSIHQVSISNNGLYTCLVNNAATGRNNSKVKEVIIVGKWLLVTSGPISGVGSGFLRREGKKEVHSSCPP